MFLHKCLLLGVQSSKILKLTTELVNNASSPSFKGTLDDSKKPPKPQTKQLAGSLFLPISLLCVLPR